MNSLKRNAAFLGCILFAIVLMGWTAPAIGESPSAPEAVDSAAALPSDGAVNPSAGTAEVAIVTSSDAAKVPKVEEALSLEAMKNAIFASGGPGFPTCVSCTGSYFIQPLCRLCNSNRLQCEGFCGGAANVESFACNDFMIDCQCKDGRQDHCDCFFC